MDLNNTSNYAVTANTTEGQDVVNATTPLVKGFGSTKTSVVEIYFIVVGTIVNFCGLSANVVIVMCAIKEPKLRSAANMLVVILAGFTAVFTLTAMAGTLGVSEVSHGGCVLFAATWLAQTHSCHWIAVVISVNRYVLVTKSKELYNKLFNKKTIAIYSTLTTVAMIILSSIIPGIKDGGQVVKISAFRVCFFTDHFYISILSLVLECISSVVVFLSYGLLLIYVKRNTLTTAKKKDVKISVILFTTALLYLISNTIYPAVMRLFPFKTLQSPATAILVDTATHLIFLLRYGVLPVIYVIRVDEFKKTAKRVFCFPANHRVQPAT